MLGDINLGTINENKTNPYANLHGGVVTGMQ